MARYSRKTIQTFLHSSDNAPNSDQKGDFLEQLALYLFNKIPSVRLLRRNVFDRHRSAELDVVLWTHQTALDFLGTILIVECKNTADPLGSEHVRWFAEKLRDKGQKYGVLITLSGISGANGGINHAHHQVINAVERDGISILIIKREEILGLTSTDEFVSLLREKLVSLVIDQLVM